MSTAKEDVVAKIDVNFDVRTDSNGKDPDSASKTLKYFHSLLWSKKTPSGVHFTLNNEPGKYLIHDSKLGQYSLSSDTISNSWGAHKALSSFRSEISEDTIGAFRDAGSVVGATILFPGRKINGIQTINVLRGFNPKIRDRFDLTLECIRLHYLGQKNPLSEPLTRYGDFFSVFKNFEGYVEFFLLQDLISKNEVNFFLPPEDGFSLSPYPDSKSGYMTYMNNTVEFISKRSQRIKNWSDKNL